MYKMLLICVSLMLVTTVTQAEEAPDESDKLISGMSIVGNDEAPKSLVIVPWKSSELGETLDVSRALDDGRQPVDRDVFMRELDYYQITTGSGAGLDPANR
jgi:hypothetical protein